MRHKALVLLFTSLLFSSFALAQGKPAEKASAGVPDKAFMEKISEAWSTMNLDNIAKYYDPAPSLAFYDIAPLKYTGWAQYAAGSKQEFAGLKSIKFIVNDDAAVHHAGNLAWGTATVKTTMTDKAGKVTKLDCRWTVVWEKKGASWVIVHEHFSAPMEARK